QEQIKMTVAVKPTADPKTMAVVDELVRRGRAAMSAFASADQARVDEAVTALAWSLYNPAHAKELAELAVKDTQLGNVPDKIIKKQRKTFGTLRDLLRVSRSASSRKTRNSASSNTRNRSASFAPSLHRPIRVRHR